MPTPITSAQNPRIKGVVKLAKHGERAARRATVVEGRREIARALARGVTPHEAYICPELTADAEAGPLLSRLAELEQDGSARLFTVTPELFAKMAYRGDSGGLLLVIPYVTRPLDALPTGSPAFLALIEGAEKPGNLGAILRTADAAGVDGVVVCAAAGQSVTDVHNPNAVRASLGTLFSVPVSECRTGEAIAWLRSNAIRLVAATPAGSLPYTAVDYMLPTAIALGSEADGLSAELLAAADAAVFIPMYGLADSLNLATAAALLLYEARRQRDAAR